MTTKYTLFFSDTNKASFDLQAYTKNGPESPSDPAIITGATTAATTLKLWGRGNKEYGEPVFQDLIYMLENFANSTAPVFPIEGQMWYDNSTLPKLFAYDGTAWDAIIMANGSSAMQVGKELILGINPTNSLGAVTLQLHQTHTTDNEMHLATGQDAFLDALDLPALTGIDVNSLIGIGSPVQSQFDDMQLQIDDINAFVGTGGSPDNQTQFDNIYAELDDKVSRVLSSTLDAGVEILGLLSAPTQPDAAASGKYVDDQVIILNASIDNKVSLIANSTMGASVNLTFGGGGSPPGVGGEVLGLPNAPTVQNAAASGKYVDDQIVIVNTTLDNKVSLIADSIMIGGVNLTFSAGGSPLVGGEILGLPDVPSVSNAATSRQYVDDQIILANATSGDGVLTNTTWLNNGLGSPLPNVFENTLRLTVSFPGSPPLPDVTFDAKGISRSGHTHTAVETTFDNSVVGPTYGDNVQSAIEEAAAEIELLKTGGVPPSATITVQRIFEVLSSPLTVAGSPVDTFAVQNHFVDDNRISLSVNGVKQYTHTRGSQSINYSTEIDEFVATGLDELQTYEFDIAINGGAATTIIIAGGSPVDITTHGGLVSAINTQLAGLDVTFSFNLSGGVAIASGEIFETISSGGASSISITDPVGSPNIYLFAGGSPLGLDNFIEVAPAVNGIEGDYQETDINGDPVAVNGFSSYVVFNYDIITGSKIESLLYV